MSTLHPPNFGALLRRDRRAAGLTQQELAALAGVSVDAVSLLERGLTRAPHRDTLNLLANALHLGPAEVAEWQLTAQRVWRARLAGAGALFASAGNGSYSSAGSPQEGSARGFSRGLAQGSAYCEPPAARSRPPVPATALIGRAEEVRAISTLLLRPEVRVLTITGTAGVGKTRIALQVAADLAEVFEKRVHFIPLATLTDPELVLPAVAEALGPLGSPVLTKADTRPALALLAAGLREQQTLLVLDNFEQIIAAAPHLAALLEAYPGLKLLVTSREVLRIRGEQQYPVPPLPLPVLPVFPSHATVQAIETNALEELEQNPAVQLLLQRAQEVQPDFHLSPVNAVTLAEICRRLEGIPLAIELAAPHLKLLSPQSLLARLQDEGREGPLRALRNGARDLPERQRTMRATIAWSYNLLSPAERALFRRVSVFAGGWTLKAAEQVGWEAGAFDLEALDGLSSLLDKSLISRDHGSHSNDSNDEEARFSMLYVLREFGLEQLEAEGEGTATRGAHASYYLAFMEEASTQAEATGPKSRPDWLNREHDNLRAALNWWLEQAEKENAPEPAERAMRLWWSWSQLRQWRFSRSCYRDGYAGIERILEVRARMPGWMQVKALLYAASVLYSVDEMEPAEALAQEALALARQIGDLSGISFALEKLGAFS